MKWRREFGIYDEMTPEYLEVEVCQKKPNTPTRDAHRLTVMRQGETGKEIIYGFDTSGRPALFMYPSRQNTDGQKRQLQFAIFMLERAIDLMGPGLVDRA